MAAVVLVAGATIAAALALRDRERPTGVAQTAPLRVKLRVEHIPIQVIDGQTVQGERKEIGKNSFAVAFADGVRLAVELSESGYAYIVAFNADGKEQLLWPYDPARKSGNPNERPPQRQQLEFPTLGGQLFRLNDDATGGAQVFAVLASRKPLPAWVEWRRRRGRLPWKKQAVEGVWVADVGGTYPRGGGVEDRGEVEDWPGMPPLTPLCRALLADGVEQVEVLAFAVKAKEGGR